MIALLKYLIHFCPQLFEKPGFRFKDSRVGLNPFAGSWILLESDDVQIFLSNEREELSWEMKSLHDSKKKNWFSFDLIARLLGHEVATGNMDAANSDLLSKNLDNIIMRFRKEEVNATLAKLNELKAGRAKRM
jgi:hypothetical protein